METIQHRAEQTETANGETLGARNTTRKKRVKSEAVMEDDEEQDLGEPRKLFADKYPSLAEDKHEIWEAFNRDTHGFDMTQPWLCTAVRDALEYTMSCAGAQGPSDQKLQEIIAKCCQETKTSAM
ncbi:hypothetical protein LTR37_017406 [Vermiconidia calcicola]|uniref:Uncharacterized protein n=1 Tax=Vermiconidia calcicola TaxID=1690605 RepID=A0ACC3MLQ4_9PEZI|nr:hypothetical protein LTR37_017406 [Vermiconidia calcicola]